MEAWLATQPAPPRTQEVEEEGEPEVGSAVALEVLLRERLALRHGREDHAAQIAQLEADRGILRAALQHGRRRNLLPWQQHGAVSRTGGDWRRLQRALDEAVADEDATEQDLLRQSVREERDRLQRAHAELQLAHEAREGTVRRQGELAAAHAAAQQQTQQTTSLAQEMMPVLENLKQLQVRQCWLLEHRHAGGEPHSADEPAGLHDAPAVAPAAVAVGVQAVAVRRARLYTAEAADDQAPRHKAKTVAPLEAGEVVRCTCQLDADGKARGEWLQLTERGVSVSSVLAEGAASVVRGLASQPADDRERGVGCWVRRAAMHVVSQEEEAAADSRGALPSPTLPPGEVDADGLPPAVTGRLDHALGFGIQRASPHPAVPTTIRFRETTLTDC